MTIKTVIGADGSVTTTDDGEIIASVGPVPAAPAHAAGRFDHASFIGGLIVGMLVLALLQAWLRGRARTRDRLAAIGPQPENRMAAEVAALARRTATLETIVTDPGVRTAREIEALR